MVVAGKIFKLADNLTLPDIAVKLDGYRKEETYEEAEYVFSLVTEVAGLLTKQNMLTGIYSHDYVMHIFHRGETAPLPRTVEALFSFTQIEDTILLAVVEKKRVANFVANKLSELLFGNRSKIVETRIPPEILQEFHLKNPEDTKITFFDNVDIPNVNKLSLYGPDLISTTLFEDYTKHGDLWYVVARSKKTGYVVGITRDASVTIFNLSEKNKYVDYLNLEIYPIILESIR